ncbi:MAG: hypothetical protein ACRDV6_04715 [Acidimicrobiales bacterium]
MHIRPLEGRPRRLASSKALLAVAVALSALALGGVAGGSTGGAVLTKSGPADEGPYPYAYPASGTVKVGQGSTISGIKCKPGVNQFASPYAPPCIAHFTGNNGGATSRGVTSNEILLAQREFPVTSNSQQIASQAAAAGVALPQVTDQIEQVFLKYFNKVYDLYGRKVVIQPMNATGNSTTEALNQGQAQACADAATITDQMHAFAESGLLHNFQGGGTGPFSLCAAQDHLVEFAGNAYFDEASFQKENPYVWALTQNCTDISQNEAEVVGTMLGGKKAAFAGDPTLQTKVRKFGTYVPNVPAYLSCTQNAVNLLTKKYHVAASDLVKFAYGLDISTFSQSAQQAIVQFKAAGVTTVILACDPYSMGLLTMAAVQQNYHPEWFTIGTALTDADPSPQTYANAAEVTGHLFGMSEASPSNVLTGPKSLAGKLYQKLTGHVIPKETDGDYGQLVEIFDMLQAAGPDLTPQNLARGIRAIGPLGAPVYQYGKWSWNIGTTGKAGVGEHTAGVDARFIWWNGNGISPLNHKPGTYVAAFGGKRFTLGQWPTKLPPMFTTSG